MADFLKVSCRTNGERFAAVFEGHINMDHVKHIRNAHNADENRFTLHFADGESVMLSCDKSADGLDALVRYLGKEAE